MACVIDASGGTRWTYDLELCRDVVRLWGWSGIRQQARVARALGGQAAVEAAQSVWPPMPMSATLIRPQTAS